MTLCDDLCILGHSAEHASMSNVRNMIRRKWRAAGLTVSTLTGATLSKALPALAALRIEVFRDFPYLYDGDLEYERGYLETFSEAAGAIIVIARDGDQIVGASTGLNRRALLLRGICLARPLSRLGDWPRILR